ncbi:hypothetical protein MKY25_13615 [Geobacillus sp. FSL W8-0032]|uniref:Uncharacterized protein n=1 Tax=Geobacillus icigianus TaxID=1430331 RepID=A0ABU6BBE4_9BACL|nr:hypothetical protein [Geobacillus icigianus]MEB3749245.1 hypothetical protein [Geobacillus icigianus]
MGLRPIEGAPWRFRAEGEWASTAGCTQWFPLRFAMTTLNDWSALGIGQRKNGGTATGGALVHRLFALCVMTMFTTSGRGRRWHWRRDRFA